MAFRRKRTFKKRAPRRRFAKKRGVKRPTIKKMIRREIARNVEDKVSQYYDPQAGLLTVNSTEFGATNMFPLGPTSAFGPIINQGTSQSARIGNRIKTKKLTIKGTLIPVAYNATTNVNPQPLLVKMWIMYDKTNPLAEPNPVSGSDFFQLGGSTTGFTGRTTDMWAPVNTDRYRILKTKTFKLGFADYSGTAGGGAPIQQYYANNDFPMIVNFSFNLTKYYPKLVRFNDNNALPTTRGLFMLVEYVTANGSPSTAQQTMVLMQYVQDYVFEDA